MSNKSKAVEQSVDTVLAGLPSKSARIRYLNGQNWTRSEIAKKLGIKYQFVRNVLCQIPPVAKQ
jgi:hypothetical protein